MMDYHNEISKLRSEFELVDLSNTEQVLEWFVKHSHLSTNDHAQIANKSSSYIRKLKKSVGLSNNNYKPPSTNTKSIKIITLSVPTNWDSKQWLSCVSKVYSISSIAKACGVSRRTILRKLAKYDIKRYKLPISTNKCCTWDWCNLHYNELGWSQSKCAKKAGICQQTFANWLNHFKIPVRSNSESIHKSSTVRLWVRKLKNQLTDIPIVRKVYLRKDHIHVRFKNYFWESYYFVQTNKKLPPYSYYITKKDSIINKIPAVYPEYELEIDQNILNDDGLINSPHIIINRSDIKSSSFIEKRLALHEFCRQITTRKWEMPSHPQDILIQEYDYLSSKPSLKIIDGALTIFCNNKKLTGRKIMESFHDIRDKTEIFKSPKYTIKLLNNLLNRKDLKFNLHNLLRLYSAGVVKIPKSYSTYRMINPAIYLKIFDILKIDGSVLDLKPGYGSKAIAASIAGLSYYTTDDHNFNQALKRGFGDFLKLKHKQWRNNKVDLILLDNNFDGVPNLVDLKEYLKFGTKLIIYVPNDCKEEYYKKLSPKSIIPIKTKWYQNQVDYLFVW